ncbi:MAG: hypothetical protein V1743_02615 [Nanoarchaeota archaeon]
MKHCKGLVWILTISFLLSVVLTACTNDDVTTIAKLNPVISQFMDRHPQAEVSATHFSQGEFADIEGNILFYCNHNSAFVNKTAVEPGEYYLLTISDQDSGLYIIAWINWDNRMVECAVKGNSNEEGIIEPPTSNVVEPPTPTDPLPGAEEKFQEIACNNLPEQATHMTSGLVAVLIPQTLHEELNTAGFKLSFSNQNGFSDGGQYYNPESNGDRYYWNCWTNGGTNTHLCIIPITAELADENGNDLGEEAGGIILTFEGPLEALTLKSKEAQTTEPEPAGDHPVPTPTTPLILKWIPMNEQLPPNREPGEKEAVQTFTRVGCKVDFEKACTEEQGYGLCGQCHYADFIGAAKEDSRIVSNLGVCMYCPTGTRCNWGALGICGEGFNCIGGGNNGGGGSQYYVSCSQCRDTPPTYSYRGGSFETCNYDYNACVQAGCSKILDNCR